jgi:hypothetical protein
MLLYIYIYTQQYKNRFLLFFSELKIKFVAKTSTHGPIHLNTIQGLYMSLNCIIYYLGDYIDPELYEYLGAPTPTPGYQVTK